jgi:hypothetical protein
MSIAGKLNELYSVQAKAETQNAWIPRPSGLGGCMREAAWLLSGAEREPRSPESMRVLELGSQRGAELAKRAKEIWPDAELEKEVTIPVPWGTMKGHIDLWIPSELLIVDFKTAGAYAMGLVASGEKQDEGYALQLNAYRHGIADLFDWQARSTTLADTRTILVYEAKDSDARKGVTAGMLVEQEIPYTAELEDAYQARLRHIFVILGKLSEPSDVPGVYGTKQEWRCKCAKDGRPLYCSIGPTRGACKP